MHTHIHMYTQDKTGTHIREAAATSHYHAHTRVAKTVLVIRVKMFTFIAFSHVRIGRAWV